MLVHIIAPTNILEDFHVQNPLNMSNSTQITQALPHCPLKSTWSLSPHQCFCLRIPKDLSYI